MPKLGLTEDDMRSQTRKYTQTHREAWKALGFRLMTAQVHDDDRVLVLAELEVRKWQRLVTMAMTEDTDRAVIRDISLRNINKIMDKFDRDYVKKRAESSVAKGEVEHFLKQGQHYLHKHTGVKSNYDPEAPADKRIKLEARFIAYANLAAAYFKLALVRVDHAERTSVFGLKEGAE